MKKRTLGILCVLIACSGVALAQTQSPAKTSVVPNLLTFSGTASGVSLKPTSGMVGITFALYKDQQGSAPLWLETQSVAVDKSGHYSVSLGATKAEGLPADIFTSGEAKWLGVQVEGQAEQPRILLLSVPYALKAADAETVGGLPPSAFVLAGPVSSGSSAASDAGSSGTAPSAPPPAAITGTGTANFVPLFTGASTIGNSVLFQSGTGATAKIGVNTSTPAATLDVKGAANVQGLLTSPAAGTATTTAGKPSQAHNFVASSFSSSTSAAVNQTFLWKAEPVRNNTATPSATLNLLFGSGTTAPAETGLKLSSNGLFTFATGQTFPGTGTITGITTASGSGLSGGGTIGNLTMSLLKTCATKQVLQWNGTAWVCATSGTGTITGVTAGTDLTGGGTSGNITLNLNATALQSANDVRYARLAAANLFTQPQTISSTAGTGLTVSSSSATARALYGHASNTGSGPAFGVLGGAEGVDGVGVWGYSNGSGGYGVQGKGATNGILGWPVTNSSIWNTYGSVGVHGDNGAPGGYGVLGTVDQGVAVMGITTGGGNGVVGSGVNGSGVVGASSSGAGVSGSSSTSTGVTGQNSAGSYGVYGYNGSQGYGMYAQGGANQGYGVGIWAESFGQSHFPNGQGSDGVDGIANSVNGTGVVGINRTSGVGVAALSNGGFAFQSIGDATQSRDSGGWAKAMVFVDPFTPSGTAITRCYNALATGAAVHTPPCGFGIAHYALGVDLIDFGFQVNDRFISATHFNADSIIACVSDPNNVCVSAGGIFPNANQVLTLTYYSNGNTTDTAFWLIVF